MTATMMIDNDEVFKEQVVRCSNNSIINSSLIQIEHMQKKEQWLELCTIRLTYVCTRISTNILQYMCKMFKKTHDRYLHYALIVLVNALTYC